MTEFTNPFTGQFVNINDSNQKTNENTSSANESKPAVIKTEAKTSEPKVEPAESPKEELTVQSILEEYNFMEGTIPVNHVYWKLKHAGRK